MNFEEALKAMREGKKVRRESWCSSSFYIGLRADSLWASDGSRWPIETCEVLADDWEIVRETFDFLEACLRMKAGKRVRRVSGDEDQYLFARGDTIEASRFPRDMSTLDSMLATDWTEVDA